MGQENVLETKAQATTLYKIYLPEHFDEGVCKSVPKNYKGGVAKLEQRGNVIEVPVIAIMALAERITKMKELEKEIKITQGG